MAVDLGTIYASLGLRMDRFVQAKEQAKIHITALERRMIQMEEASNLLAKGVLAAGAAMGAAGMYSIHMAAQMEQAEIAFGTLLGSGEKAKEFLDDLATFAARTPFDLPGLRQSSRMLLAFGFQAEEIIPMMTAVGDSVAALGGGTFEIQRVVRALGQMQAKGRVSSQEMMQLAELGVPAWEMLAKEIGVSVPEAMKLAEQGAIDGMTGVNALVTAMGQRFEGAMDDQSKSILGMWSTIMDNLNITAAHTGNALIEAFDISDHMQNAIEALDELRITMEAFAKVVEERGIAAAFTELFGPGTTTAVLALGGAILTGLVPSIYAATKALWLKFAALAALKPWLLVGAAAGGILAASMIAQTEATRGSNKSLQDHIDELRRQQSNTRQSTTETRGLRTELRNTGRTAQTTGRNIADAAREAQNAIQTATRRIDRLHDALVNALRRKYSRERDIALSHLDEIYRARRRTIEQQLDALDEGARQEDHTRNMGEKQDALSLLQRELMYETDMRRRADIQNRIAELQKEINEETRRFERESERNRLQEQLEALGEEETNVKTATENIWDKRLEDAKLGGEAEKLIIAGNQQAILELLKTYGDGWRDIGATFGQRLIEGMGTYPEELRNMVVGALNDVRAAADGTIARLRLVAEEGTRAAQAGAGVGVGVGRTPARVDRLTLEEQHRQRQQAEQQAMQEYIQRAGRVQTPRQETAMQRHLQGVAARPAVIGARPEPSQINQLTDAFNRHVAIPLSRVLENLAGDAGLIRRREPERPDAVTHTGPLINIQTMNVRKEDDIQNISRNLHRQIQSGTRARGGR